VVNGGQRQQRDQEGIVMNSCEFCGFVENGVKLTRGERQINNVSDGRDKNRCAFLEKPSGDKIRIRLLVRTVRQNLEDFRFRSKCERGEIRRCCRRRGECGDDVIGIERD